MKETSLLVLLTNIVDIIKVYLPVTCANSTISAPNTENAFTNSVKFATDSNLPKDFAT